MSAAEWLNWLGRLHVQSVHFPIALLMAAALAEWLGWLSGRERLAGAGRYCLYLATLGGLLAVVLGWLNAGWQWQYDGGVEAMAAHRWLGTAVLGWMALLVGLSIVAQRRSGGPWVWAYRVGLLIGAGMVAATAHLGGVIVHGAAYFAPPW